VTRRHAEGLEGQWLSLEEVAELDFFKSSKRAKLKLPTLLGARPDDKEPGIKAVVRREYAAGDVICEAGAYGSNASPCWRNCQSDERRQIDGDESHEWLREQNGARTLSRQAARRLAESSSIQADSGNGACGVEFCRRYSVGVTPKRSLNARLNGPIEP